MAFHLPTFDLTCNVWTAYGGTFPIPGGTVPNLVGVPCQLRFQLTGAQVAAALTSQAATLLLLPRGTDVRGSHAGSTQDTVECPAGTGRYYRVAWVEDRAKGFPNEYRVAGLVQLVQTPGGWPFPTP